MFEIITFYSQPVYKSQIILVNIHGPFSFASKKSVERRKTPYGVRAWSVVGDKMEYQQS